VEVADEGRPLGSQIRLWLGVIAATLLVVFLLQNLQEVEINFLWFEWHARMIVALIAAALLGAITTMIVGFIRRRGQEARLRADLAAEMNRDRRK
jgi:uncharacterized integral membrane protein